MAINTFHLSPADREQLQQVLRKGSLAVKTFKRATGLLDMDRGCSPDDIAATLNVSIRTLSNWRKSYRDRGLGMLEDQARPGRPLLIDGLQRAKVTSLACSEPPEGYSRWSLRLLADKAVELELVESLSFRHAARILKKTNSNPT